MEVEERNSLFLKTEEVGIEGEIERERNILGEEKTNRLQGASVKR